jgi:hypothetical protein
MRNLLEESSVAQCLDGERLKGRLLSPIAKVLLLRERSKEGPFLDFGRASQRNSAESGSIEVSLVLNSLPTQHQSRPSPIRVINVV